MTTLHQTYLKQVEAWKEKFVHGGIPENGYIGWVDEGNAKFLLSSRHKDTIELLEAIIKEVEGKKIGRYQHHKLIDTTVERQVWNSALSDLLTTLQAEKELIENEK